MNCRLKIVFRKIYRNKIGLILVAVIFIYLDCNKSYLLLNSNLEKNLTIKSILIWNNPRRAEVLSFGTGQDAFIENKCFIKECYLSYYEQYPDKPLSSYDAVIFNFNEESWKLKTPDYLKNYSRSPKQLYIFLTQEPSSALSKNYNKNSTETYIWKNYFNWTMSYKLNSDIRLLYGEIQLIEDQSNTISIKEKISTKEKAISNRPTRKRKIAWLASNCLSSSLREEYIEELSKYIPVDIYGKCKDQVRNSGFTIKSISEKCECSDTHNCLEGNIPPPPLFDECLHMIEAEYKFYLSFENSICEDYITEKFFSIMQLTNILPIVYGGANYSKIAPRHSYIEANNFKPKELAIFLLKLDANDTLYDQYFWWKDEYRMNAGTKQMAAQAFCDLCEKLHKDSSVKTIDDISYFFDETECKNP